MTNPSVLASFAAAVYDRLAPIADKDQSNNYSLSSFVAAIGEMFQKVEDYSRDQTLTDGTVAPGWSQLLDVNRCPAEALPWLAQFVGTVINGNLSVDQQRQQITQAQNWKRGSVAAMRGAALPWLSGSQTVVFSERDSGAAPSDQAYGLTIYTRISETLDANAILNALLAIKPAGIVLNYATIPGQVYEDTFLNQATYAAILTTFNTYQDMLLGVNIVGGSGGGGGTGTSGVFLGTALLGDPSSTLGG